MYAETPQRSVLLSSSSTAKHVDELSVSRPTPPLRASTLHPLESMAMGKASARILWMDALRGWMILLVVFVHAAGRVRRYAPEALGYIEHFNLFWEPFRMPMLMMLSGMLLARSLTKARSYYVVGKIRQLLWPYFIWSIVFIVLLYATGAGANTEPLWAQLLGIASGTTTYLWFLSFLFVFYMLSLVITARVREFLIPVALLMTIPLMWIEGGYQWRKFLFLLAFFWLGDLITRRDVLRSSLLTNSAVLILGTVLAVGAGMASVLGLTPRYSPVTVIGVVGGAVCLIVLARCLSGSRVEATLAAVGRNTIVYYTSHYVIIAVAYFVLNRMLSFNHPDVLFWMLTVCALAGGWVLVHLRRFAPADMLFVMPWRQKATSS